MLVSPWHQLTAPADRRCSSRASWSSVPRNASSILRRGGPVLFQLGCTSRQLSAPCFAAEPDRDRCVFALVGVFPLPVPPGAPFVDLRRPLLLDDVPFFVALGVVLGVAEPRPMANSLDQSLHGRE